MAREAERLAHSAGMRVLWGRSVEGGAPMAFRPITEALLSAVRRDAQVIAERPELRPFRHILARLIPDWREEGAPTTAADESLVLLGLAARVELGDKLTRWEWIGDAHHHLMCRHCGLVVELDDEPFRRLVEDLARSRGVRVDVRHLALPGLCPTCTARELS